MSSYDPTDIRSQERAKSEIDKREQQQAQQEAMVQGAKTARDLASADTSGQNALTDVTQAFSGYS